MTRLVAVAGNSCLTIRSLIVLFCCGNRVVITLITSFSMTKKERGICQSKVTSSLTAIQRPGHQADNCKMVYTFDNHLLLGSLNFQFFLSEFQVAFR